MSVRCTLRKIGGSIFDSIKLIAVDLIDPYCRVNLSVNQSSDQSLLAEGRVLRHLNIQGHNI